MTRASPIYWKVKQRDCVCHSSKDAETLNLLNMVDDSVYAAHQLEQLLYGDVLGRIPVLQGLRVNIGVCCLFQTSFNQNHVDNIY